MGFLLTSLGFPGPITLSLFLGSWACHKPLTLLVCIVLGLRRPFSHFSTSYSAHGMLFLSFLASLSPLASSRSIYLFVGPMIHLFICWACDPLFLPLGPNGSFCYLPCQFFVALIIGLFCLPGLPQMALNTRYETK